jgi:exodeoxyribonuclease VII small subunit
VAAKDSKTPIPKTPDSPDVTNLISIVAQLEGGQIGLEDSMALWQRGEALATHCNTWLDGAEAKLTTGSNTEPSGPTGQG